MFRWGLITLFLQPGPRYKWSKVALILFCSLAICGSAAGLGWYYYWVVRPLIVSKKNTGTILAIAQTSRSGRSLEGVFLAEAMGLCIDRQAPLDLFEAKEKLLKTDLFKNVSLKIIKPHTLFVDYELRSPIATLGNYTNTLIDEEGVFFPSAPFFSPRLLPEIRLEHLQFSTPWGEKMPQTHLTMAATILRLLGKRSSIRIDLSQADEATAGKKQIIVLLNKTRILRLTTKNYPQELSRYLILEKTILNQDSSPLVVDLRIPDIAYIERT